MESRFTGAVNGKEVDFCLTDNRLEWEDHEAHAKKSVNVDKIIAVIPHAKEQETSSATVIVLRKPASEPVARPQGNYWWLHWFEVSKLPSYLFSKYGFSLSRHLQPLQPDGSVSTIHVVVSTFSGTKEALAFFNNVVKPFLSLIGVNDYQVHETRSARTISELTETIFLPRAQGGFPQTIILLSGDGGLSDLIKVVSAAPTDAKFVPPNIAMIPMGTGNALANSAGLLSDSTFGLSALLRGSPQPLPTFRVTLSPNSIYMTDKGRRREPLSTDTSLSSPGPEIYGAVVVSWGLHASLVADSDTTAYRKFGVDRFKMVAKELLYPSDGTDSHSYKGIVTLIKRDVNGGEIHHEVLDRTEHMYVLLTLVSELEKGFTISPSSKPLDGQLRVVHFPPLAPDEVMNVMNLAYRGGQHVSLKAVGYEAVDGLKIEIREEDERWRRICIDGEIVLLDRGGWLEVRRETRSLVRLIA